MLYVVGEVKQHLSKTHELLVRRTMMMWYADLNMQRKPIGVTRQLSEESKPIIKGIHRHGTVYDDFSVRLFSLIVLYCFLRLTRAHAAHDSDRVRVRLALLLREKNFSPGIGCSAFLLPTGAGYACTELENND